MDIDKVIKKEIDAALVEAKEKLAKAESNLVLLKDYVTQLEKSAICEHSFDSGCYGLQIEWDICSKCNWHHTY